MHNKEFQMAWSTYGEYDIESRFGHEFDCIHEPWDECLICPECEESYSISKLFHRPEGFCSNWCEKASTTRADVFLKRRILSIAKRIGIVYTLKLNKVINY